ncbi:MAG: hypothetical protein AB7T63_14320 [Planctomycetota bacterium]
MGALMSHRRRSLLVGAAALVALAFVLGSTPPADAKMWPGDSHKCELTIPDAPAPWDFLPHDSSWSKYDIVVGAERRLKELRDGTPANGEGGLLHLAVSTAPEGATLEGLAADEKVREFLTARFTEGGKDIEVVDEVLNDDLPCKVLRTSGKAANFKATQADCSGRMIVALGHGRVYKLRMYGWGTPDDLEGVRDDLDYIEVNGLTITDAKNALPSSEGEGAENPNAGAVDEPVEEGEEERLEWEELNLVMVKHKNLTREEPDRDEARQNVIAKFTVNTTHAYYNITLYAFPVVGGQQRVNFESQVGTSFYEQFLESHPEGPIWVHPWPKKPETVKNGSTFLLFPDCSDEARDVISDDSRRKPDPKAGLSALQKMNVVEKPKVKNVGPDFKVPGNAFRAVLGGNRDSTGPEVNVKYGWLTNEHDFILYVGLAREAYLKYGDAIRATLESIRHPKKWEKRWADYEKDK